MRVPSKENSDVVYTVLFGRYERLNEQPLAATSNARFICFTDCPDLESETWDVQVVKPVLEGDGARSSRWIKTLAYRDLEADRSLYIDNSVVLTGDPCQLLDTWLSNSSVAMMQHQARASVAEEISVCLRRGLDTPTRLKEQRAFYRCHFPEALRMQPYWGGMIARRHGIPEVDQLMNTWFLHILRFSRRDQISLPAAMIQTGVSVHGVEGLINSTIWHSWPVSVNRNYGQRVVTFQGRIIRTLGTALGRTQ